jgi:hypothetical protein
VVSRDCQVVSVQGVGPIDVTDGVRVTELAGVFAKPSSRYLTKWFVCATSARAMQRSARFEQTRVSLFRLQVVLGSC